MKEEGMEGDTSENRRGGGLWKKTEDGKAYRTIFFLPSWSWWWGGESLVFSYVLFAEGVCSYIHETRGAGSNLIPCSALANCTNISPGEDVSNAVRGARTESRSWAVVGWRFVTFVCVGHLLSFFFFLMMRFCWSLSPSHILIWMDIRGQKWCCYF